MGFKDLPIRVLFFVLASMMMVYVAFPLMTSMASGFMQSNNGNCPGYVDTVTDGRYSYNSSLPVNGVVGSCQFASMLPGIAMVMYFIAAISYLIFGGGNETPDVVESQYQ